MWTAWYSGVVLAIVGNLAIAASLILQKKVHMLVASTAMPAERHPLFPVALLGLIVGEVGNFAAFGLASPTVVSPLGAVAVIANAVMSALLLHEPFLIRNVIGLVLTLLGSVVVVIEAPSAELHLTVESFIALVASRTGVAFFAVTLAAIGALLVLEPRRPRGPGTPTSPGAERARTPPYLVAGVSAGQLLRPRPSHRRSASLEYRTGVGGAPTVYRPVSDMV